MPTRPPMEQHSSSFRGNTRNCCTRSLAAELAGLRGSPSTALALRSFQHLRKSSLQFCSTRGTLEIALSIMDGTPWPESANAVLHRSSGEAARAPSAAPLGKSCFRRDRHWRPRERIKRKTHPSTLGSREGEPGRSERLGRHQAHQ